MFKQLGYIESEIGTVQFSINDGGFFEVNTPKCFYAVDVNELVKRDGRHYFSLPTRDFKILNDVIFSEVEIPADVLEEMEKALIEFKLQEKSVGRTETAQGYVYFSISGDAKIIAKIGENATKAGSIYNIEGKNVAVVPDLNLSSAFVEVPQEVESEFNRVKRKKESDGLHLVYAGRSMLTGTDYYAFNYDVPQGTMFRVKELFEYVEEEDDAANLGGWLTSNPELVEKNLRLRSNTIKDRAGEIEKKKAEAVKTNLKIIKQLTAKSATEA